MDAATTIAAEPAGAAPVVIGDRYGNAVLLAARDGRWVDLTCPEPERVAQTWASFEPATVAGLGEPIDPAAAEEPADGTRIVARRVNAGTGVITWYTLLRDDSDVPALDHLREAHGTGPLEKLDSDSEDYEEQRAEEERALNARWFLEGYFAEWDAVWGSPYGDFLWSEIGTDGNPQITVTVFPVGRQLP